MTMVQRARGQEIQQARGERLDGRLCLGAEQIVGHAEAEEDADVFIPRGVADPIIRRRSTWIPLADSSLVIPAA